MKKRSPEQRQKDDVRLLIEEAKIRNNLGDGQLAHYLGFCERTLRERKSDPGPLTLDKLLLILEMTGKEIRYVEKL